MKLKPIDLVARQLLWEAGCSVADFATALNVTENTANQKLLRGSLDIAELSELSKLIGIAASKILEEVSQ
jgi:plasmid maintenance system antidote protein VapI